MKDLEIFKLEDRVLFEAAAAAEIVEAAAAVQDHADDHAADSEKENLSELVQIQNVTPENPAASAQEQGQAQIQPEDITDVDALVDQLIEGEIPSADGDAMDIAALADPQTDAGAEADNNMVEGKIVDNGLTLSTEKELVVVNGSVADKEDILSKLTPDQEVLILEDGNGLSELNAYLDSQDTKYSAIHFITHGNEGYISLNGELVKNGNFDSAEWSELGEHLTEDGDILFYGCNTAANADGQQLLEKIADATGADVAASTDTTGISGNWDLEYTIGNVDAEEIVVENFEHNLTNYTVTNLDDSGDGSLRQAVSEANASTGTDEITFETTGTIQLESGLTISDSVVLEGKGADETIISGGNFRTFSVNADVVFEISNVSIINGNFQNNGSGNTYGGSAIYNKGITIVENCNISQNYTLADSYTSPYDYQTAKILGGAIYNSGEIHISNSQLTDNTAQGYGYYAFAQGGAIYNNNGKVTIDNSTLAENCANALSYYSNPATDAIYETAQGGSIYSTGDDSSLVITNSTVANNELKVNVKKASCISASGAAVYSADTAPVVVNSIIAGNTLTTTTTASAKSIGGTAARLINSVYDSSDNSPASGSTGNHLTTESGFSVSSMFGSSPALQNNGGSTETLALQSESNPTVISGGVWVTRYLDSNGAVEGVGYATSQSAAPALVWGSQTSSVSLTEVDQRGYTREADTSIGAFDPNATAPARESSVDSFDELKDAVEEAAANGGDYTIIVTDDITMEDGISVDIKNDLNLTIIGTDDTIDLSGGDDHLIMFEFTDDDAYDIQITIDNLNFDGNGSADTAVSAAGVEVLTVKDSKVENFSGSSAILQEGYEEGETLVIENTEFLNNENTQQMSPSGGAVSAYDVTVSISGSYFYNNSSMHNGGALEIQYAPTITIKDTTFEINSAAFDGGAANIVLSDNGELVIDNSTFYGNYTEDSGNGGDGGALFIDHTGDDSKVTVTNSTFAANTAEGIGSAIYNSDGNAEIINTLLIGNEGDTSVLAHEEDGTVDLSYSLVTSTDGSSSDSITAGTNAEIDASYHMGTVFGNNTYNSDTHTITPDAFHKAAWNGTKTGTGLDQLGNSREGINDTLKNLKQDDSKYYSMGAVSAAAGLIVTLGDYETYYTGSDIIPSDIIPKEKLTLSFASGEDLKENIVSTELSSDPDPVRAPGKYTITPSVEKGDITVTGLDTNANVVFSSVAGTLKVNKWDALVIQGTEIESVYGSEPGLESTYSVTVQDKITGEYIDLTFNVKWEIDDTVITTGDYSATDHINASFYEDSLTVKDFTVKDQNNRDMKSYFDWDDSAKSDLDVAKKSVTVTLNALENKTYNGQTDDAVFNGGTVTGAIDGETLNVVTAPGYTYGIYNSKNVADASYATFTVALEAGADTDTANYILSVNEVTADAKINPAKLTVTIDGTKFNKVYDGTTSTEAADNNHSVSGIIGNDDVSASGSFAYDNRNADTNKTVTMSGITLSGADAGNYELVSDTVSSSGAVITPANLQIKVNDHANITYGGTVTPGYTIEGTIYDPDTVTDVILVVSGEKSSSGNYVVGDHTISVDSYTVNDGNDGKNYNVTTQTDTFRINTAKLTVTIDGTKFNKVYDGTTSTETDDNNHSVSGIVGNDDVSASGSFAYDNRNAGTDKTVTMSGITLSGADAANYELVSDTVSSSGAEITAANLIIKVNDHANITYGGTVAPNYTIVGTIYDPDTVTDVTLVVSGEKSSSGNYVVGDHTISVDSFTVNDGNNGKNYNVQTTEDTFHIDTAKLTVTIDGTKFNKVYDGTTATEEADNNHSVSGIIDGDTVTASGSFAYDNRNADTNKTVTMSGITLSGADAANYELVSDTVSSSGAVITPLQLDLDILIPTEKTYDGTTDVDSEAAADNVLAGDDIVLDLQWNYNSANVNEATTITNTSWQISGEDAGNYILPSVEPYNNISASIEGKETETVFQTSAPYTFDGTDQSGTVSAFYVDINGNKVQLEIDWNGQQFKEPGIYTVTVKSSDPNYTLTGNVIELVMNEAEKPNMPVFPPVFRHPVPAYSAGLYADFSSTVPGMQANLASTPSGEAVNDNIYTMRYPELVNRSMLSYLYTEENALSAGYPEYTVSIDTLKYHPFTLDEPVREISESLIEGSSITHSSALYSGEELFAEENGTEDELFHLFKPRSTPLSVNHDPMYMDEGVYSAEKISEDYVFVPETVSIPGRVFAGDQVLEKEFNNISEVNEQYCRKLDNMKSSLEKLLDEFCLA